MTRAQVDELLRCYRSNISRRKHIIAEIARLELEIARIENNVTYIHASRLTGMPKSSAPGDSTAQVAIALATGELADTASLKAILDRLAREKTRVELDIEYVDIWLEALNERERLVLSSNMIDSLTWQSVADAYDRAFGFTVCETTLRRLKKSALGKVYGIAG